MSPYAVTAPTCIDSSVAFKWFCSDGEASVERALELLDAHREGRITLVAPAHLPAEVLNALACRNSVSDESLRRAAAALSRVEIVYPAWDEDLLECAAGLVSQYKLTFYDALFPALAMQLECPLVTADRAHSNVTGCTVTLLA